MDVLVRYGAIHRKKKKTRKQFIQALRQRISDSLDYRGLDFEKVSVRPSRILITDTEREASEFISKMPGVKSCSPVTRVEAEPDAIEDNLPEVGDSFGVRVNSTHKDFSASRMEEEIGSYIDQRSETSVDLENPDTWVRIEIRDQAYIFTEIFEGPGGLPSGVQGEYAALISGGIDSPVAAYRLMRKGADFFPIYFYNRPYAAEDHIARFERCLEELKKFHPSKNWKYGFFDLEEVNRSLMDIGKGRMLLHRRLMLELAEEIREDRGLDGVVTGESIAQKSSQTPANLRVTSRDIPVMRPLLTSDKDSVTEEARRIGTFRHSRIDAGCVDLSPNSPSTSMTRKRFEELKEKARFKELKKSARESYTEKEL